MGLGTVGGLVALVFKRIDKNRTRKEAAIDAKVLSFFPSFENVKSGEGSSGRCSERFEGDPQPESL